jgi:AcrR family transcriptional regulator
MKSNYEKALCDALLNATLSIAAEEGFRAATFPRVAKKANVAYNTVARHFDGKESLDCAALKLHGDRWREWFFSEIEERAVSPHGRVSVFFALLDEWVHGPDFRGCLFQRAMAEYPKANNPIRHVVEEHRAAVFALLEKRVCMAAGKDRRESLAQTLAVAMEGALALSATYPKAVTWAKEAVLHASKQVAAAKRT